MTESDGATSLDDANGADGGNERVPSTMDAALNRDPVVGLRAVAALRRLAERLEALQVGNARQQGWSWDEIGAALGVSRQAVHKKHARR